MVNVRVAGEHKLKPQVGILLAADVKVAVHIVFADERVNGRGRNQRVVRHRKDKLPVFARIFRLFRKPLIAVVGNTAFALEIAVVVNREQPVAVL